MNDDLEKKRISNKKRDKYSKIAKEKFGTEVGEDSTKYGEFVSSYFAWLSLPKQKEKAEEMENMTDTKNENER